MSACILCKVVLVKFDVMSARLIPVRLFNFEQGAVGTGARFAQSMCLYI